MSSDRGCAKVSKVVRWGCLCMCVDTWLCVEGVCGNPNIRHPPLEIKRVGTVGHNFVTKPFGTELVSFTGTLTPLSVDS